MGKLRKYLVVFKVSIQNQLAYVSSFVASFIFYAFVIFVFINLWRVIYHGREAIAGFSYTQVIWYCIITEMIVMSAGGGIFNEISSDIKNGNIGYYLNKPYSYIFYNFSNCMGQSVLKLVIIAGIGTLMGLLFLGPVRGFKPENLPFLLIAILLGILLNFFIFSAVGLLAFWFEENSAFFWILQKIMFMGGLFFPLDMMPGWLREIALMLPFSYVTYAPARLFVSFHMEDFLRMASVQAGYAVLLMALNFFMYGRGVKAINVHGG